MEKNPASIGIKRRFFKNPPIGLERYIIHIGISSKKHTDRFDRNVNFIGMFSAAAQVLHKIGVYTLCQKCYYDIRQSVLSDAGYELGNLR